MSDQVPLGIMQVAQSAHFGRKFLHPVLAEDAQPGGVGLADAFDRESLAHAHQRDVRGIASDSPCRCCDPLPHPRNIFGNRHKAKTTKDTKYHEGEPVLLSFVNLRVPSWLRYFDGSEKNRPRAALAPRDIF